MSGRAFLVGLVVVGLFLFVVWRRHCKKELVRRVHRGVDLVKAGVALRLLARLKAKYEEAIATRLAATMANELVPWPPPSPESQEFLEQNRDVVERELHSLQGDMEIRKAVTQAVRAGAVLSYAHGESTWRNLREPFHTLRSYGLLVPGGDFPTLRAFLAMAQAFYATSPKSSKDGDETLPHTSSTHHSRSGCSRVGDRGMDEPKTDGDELVQRVRRIYAAIGDAEERDMTKLPATVVKTDRFVAVQQDFSGGLTTEKLENIAYSLIQNIGNLRDHLRKWAAKNGRDKSKVETAFNGSVALQIITDLSNNDKHGYPPRDGGYSGKSPRLTGITRVLKLTTTPEDGSFVGVTLDARGAPKAFGSGSAKAVLTGEILDKDGEQIGDLHDTALEAVEAWEQLLREYDAGGAGAGVRDAASHANDNDMPNTQEECS